MADHGTGTIDSEASVDYYVTTVNGHTSKHEPTRGKFPKVVSVDRAGSVKVRKRKKSKRRKKRSTLVVEGSTFPTSDDDLSNHTSASDGSINKLPKRSASLTERDLYKNSKVTFTEEFAKLRKSDKNEKKSTEELSAEATVVKRRNRKKTSFRNKRRGFYLDSIEAPVTSEDASAQVDDSKQPAAQPISRKDVLATLDMFMEEVKEAATVAKQRDERRKDSVMRRSRSLDHLDLDLEHDSVAEKSATEVDAAPTTAAAPTRTSLHHKSESLGQASVFSGTVFTSDQEVSIDEGKSPNAELTSLSDVSNRRSNSLEDLVMAADVATLSKLIGENALTKQPANGFEKQQSLGSSRPPSTKQRSDTDYGLAHLEQVCRLMEQIANLKNENEALQLKVHVLESRLKELGDDKGLTGTLQYKPKRSQTVDNYINSRFQKLGVERNQSLHEIRAPSQQSDFVDESSDPNPFAASQPQAAFGTVPADRPVIYTNVNLKNKNKRRPYSRDDLDLSSKGKWKFWRAPAKHHHHHHHDNSYARKQVVSSITNEHTQGSAVHLKSASVTLDELLKNVDDNFSKKMMQWQTASRPSRAPSRTSVTSTDTAGRNVPSSSTSVACMPSSDDNTRSATSSASKPHDRPAQSKDSFKKKFTRWEKAAARKLSWHGDHRRSKSIDRTNSFNVNTGTTLREQKKSQGSHYKSMPCVMTGSTGNGFTSDPVIFEENGGMRTAEWSGVQEAFPTTKSSFGDPIRRLISASQSRLTAPLRKRSNKRRSWSFTKRPASKYFLPSSGDFVSSVEEAEDIGSQYTLQLDQEDIKGLGDGVNDDELQYLKKNTADLREKLREMEMEFPAEETKDARNKPVRQRPASSMARYPGGQNVPFSRHSRAAEVRHLYSCDRVAHAMSPVAEEPGPVFSSLPSRTKPGPKNGVRRHTFASSTPSGPRCSSWDPEQPTATQSAPCVLEPDPLSPVVSYITQRVTINKPSGESSDLREPSVSGTSNQKSDDEPRDLLEVKVPRKKSVRDKMKTKLNKLSPRRPRSNATTSETSHESEESAATPVRTKSARKKGRRFKIFGGKSSPKHPRVSVTAAGEQTSPVRKRQSDKIAALSKRLSEDSYRSRSSTNQSSPPRIRKGLVSRLSARFTASQKTGRGRKASQGQDSFTQEADGAALALPEAM